MTGDFAGPYSPKFHPWVKGMHNSKADTNYAMKGAQLGVTEVLINLAFYTLDQLNRDVLYVLPTTKNSSDFSKSRFTPALKNSPYLNGLFTDINSIELKQAGSNTLYIRGSRGDSNLKSIPVSVLLLDEVDEMSQRAISLALERLSGSLSKTVWGISTPTVPDFGIHELYKDSTQEHFVFKCPCCGRQTEMIWPDSIEILGDSLTDPRCMDSFLKCKECGGRLEHKDKPNWLKNAKWNPTNHGGTLGTRGFAISQLYSFTVSPGELVKAHYKGFGNEAANVEFHNSKLGLPYIGDGARVTEADLDACIFSHSKDDPRPAQSGRLITMGVDQGKWNYVEVTEWFFDKYSNDLNESAKAKVLFEFKFHEEDWYMLDELMREWQIQACVIDADPQIMEARRFARKFQGFVWLCRFRRGPSAKEITEVDDGEGAPIIHVDRSNWFSAALGRYRQPRRIELPHDVSNEYREHQKAPIRTYKKDENDNPQAVYVSTSADHFALSRVYSEIALPHAASITTGQDISRFL
jgi:phage terminase large subunit GpA-like protein